jgi:aerobic C4-dicarboxylate transport protein
MISMCRFWHLPSPRAFCLAISILISARVMKPLGDAFIKLVKMIIAPVIFLTVATGIAGMSDLQKVGRVAGKAMLYFLTFSTLALDHRPYRRQRRAAGCRHAHQSGNAGSKAVATYTAEAHEQTITGFLRTSFPTTIVGAFADGDILQVLFFSVLFGIALAMVGEKRPAGRQLPATL